MFRCSAPIIVYLMIQGAASFIVTMGYYVHEGFHEMAGDNLDQMMAEVLSSTMDNLAVLSFISLCVSYIFLIPIFIRMYRKDRRLDEEEGIPSMKKNVPWKLYGILAAGGMAGCLAGSNMISMSGLIEVSEGYASTAETLYSTGFGVELIALGILAPLTEEMLFRGLVYRRFKETSPMIPAMIWASLVFALLHGNMVQGIYAFIMGIVFCYVYERYGSMKAPILMHMSANILSVVASETSILDFVYQNQMVFYTVTFICCLIVIGAVYMIEMYVRPITEEEKSTL